MPGWLLKRQVDDTVTGFMGPPRLDGPVSCDQATTFVFDDGQLRNGTHFVSTDPGVGYELFETAPNTGSITGTFFVEDGILAWRHPALAKGEASFCQAPDGDVFAVFNGTAPPFDCVTVELVVFCGKYFPLSAVWLFWWSFIILMVGSSV
jgi:hypothetical protein